jgi:serine/threonine protein kinase
MSTESNRFGKYRLLKRVGAGGMGEVHLAKLKGPAGFEKLVVIKRLLENRRGEQRYVDMFFSEARVTAQLSHSNIVQIYEVDYCDGVPYIAMEYVRGKSLRHILDVVRKRGGLKGAPLPRLPRLPAHYVVQIFYALCSGLAFAHDARHLSGAALGLIHRDINPHNVLLTYRGDVKLIDFGIAKSELTLDKTQAGTIKGTVIYMSPEQSAGRKLDRRSDMFSVGICLYEILAGHNPFHKDNMAASLEAIRHAEVPPLDATNPQVAPFQDIVSRALAKAPDDRFADCEEMGHALQALLLEGKIPRLEVSLADYLQRLFVEDIDAEDRLLSQTELVEIADLGPSWRNAVPVVLEGEKTRALGANPVESADGADPASRTKPPSLNHLSPTAAAAALDPSAHSPAALGIAGPTAPTRPVDPAELTAIVGATQAPQRADADAQVRPAELSDVHTLADRAAMSGQVVEQSGVGAAVRLSDAGPDTRPTQRLPQADASAAVAAVAPSEVTAVRQDTKPEAFDMADEATRAEYRMPAAAAAVAPRMTAVWDIVQRRVAPLRNPRAFWNRQTVSNRLTLSVLGSVVILGTLCAALAVLAPSPAADVAAKRRPNGGKAKLAPAPGASVPGTGQTPGVDNVPGTAAASAAAALDGTQSAALGQPTTNSGAAAEASADTDEVRLEALADTPEAPGNEGVGHRPGRRLSSNRHRPRADRAHADADEPGPTSLQIATEPTVAILKDGVAVGHHVNLHTPSGVLQFGPNPNVAAGSQFSIKVHYQTHARAISYTIESEPWANVFGAGGIALGRTPIKDMPGNLTTVLEFKNPRLPDSQRITLHYGAD